MDAQVRSGGYEGFMELCSAVPLPGFKGTELVSGTTFTALHSSSLNHQLRQKIDQHANLIIDELTQMTLGDLPKITQNK